MQICYDRSCQCRERFFLKVPKSPNDSTESKSFRAVIYVAPIATTVIGKPVRVAVRGKN